MRRHFPLLALLPFVLPGFLPGHAEAGDPPDRPLHEGRPGEVSETRTKDGLIYLYRLPGRFDRESPVGVTVILHGSNLDRRWGFANHDPKTFRPDDLVLSPDGTTSNGQGGFNFLGEGADVARFRALLEEVAATVKVRQVFLYGHSQGSFFALHYAGERPEDVTGVVAHASGIWTWTRTGKAGHRQAIVLMHGTQDPVVPYGQSVGGYEFLEKQGYPVLRLFSLEGWNHWPAEHNGDVPHTSQELAWCEGMAATEADRIAAAFSFLAEVKGKERHDWAALHAVATRLLSLEAAPADLLARAKKAKAAVEALAEAHARALEQEPSGAFEAAAWVGHLPVFLRAFAGVPACDALAARWERVLGQQGKDVEKPLRTYYQALGKGDHREAFAAGAEVLEKGFLLPEAWDRSLRDNLAAWGKDAKALKIPAKAWKACSARLDDLARSLELGYRTFETVQRKAGAP